MRIVLVLGLLLASWPLVLSEAAGQQARRSRAAQPWTLSRGGDSATLVFDDCDNCGNHGNQLVVATCLGPGRQADLSFLLPPPRRGAQPLQIGSRIEVSLQIGAERFAFRGAVDSHPIGEQIGTPIAPDHAVFTAMIQGASMRMSAPNGAQDVTLRGAAGPIRAWQAACGVAPGAAAPPPPSGGLAGYARYAGGYEVTAFLRDPPIARALSGMLDAASLRRLRDNLGVHEPIALESPMLVIQGGKPRMADVENAMVTLNLETGALEIGLHSHGRVVVRGPEPRAALSAPMTRWAASFQRGGRPFDYIQVGQGQPAAQPPPSPASGGKTPGAANPRW
ncbi:hypothetical protein EJV46_09090 [Roseococcus sp. SYP-B2431]|uniref:hypothetical protein n=1 Tax=Roseococcus sp. SYP-B2431 TaxID=2496640 RepID=UPI00103FCB47|nr:hypothetical protein [Roseococcus sp. SYP-B2431]TCH98719.1 hypothetical protein EJV46_09090 [Roseococcus sp. SYP-B2431]